MSSPWLSRSMKGKLRYRANHNFVILGRHWIDWFTGPNPILSLLSKDHLLKTWQNQMRNIYANSIDSSSVARKRQSIKSPSLRTGAAPCQRPKHLQLMNTLAPWLWTRLVKERQAQMQRDSTLNHTRDPIYLVPRHLTDWAGCCSSIAISCVHYWEKSAPLIMKLQRSRDQESMRISLLRTNVRWLSWNRYRARANRAVAME